jgi:DNA-directed RNA polymerase sigma subunit (sigma70/sigma32)
MTCEEIAEILGISRQRVQQIEARALEKLQRLAAKRGLSKELLQP